MTHPRLLVQLSGGITSWAAAKKVFVPDGSMDIVCLFADTLIEDADTYRFLIEGAANLMGQRMSSVWERACAKLPPVRFTVEGRRERRAALDHLFTYAHKMYPWLVRVSDGRDPWQVMEDERMIGNTRMDPCSKILKRQLLAWWRDENCDKADTQLIFGVTYNEIHRIERLRERMLGWVVRAPLCELPTPLLSKRDCMDWAKREELTPPSLYADGFPHANCGGFCIKGGQANFKLLLTHRPDVYAEHEREEQRLRTIVGDHSILRDRIGGRTKPLTLQAFRENIQAGGQCDAFDLSGCGCAIDDGTE